MFIEKLQISFQIQKISAFIKEKFISDIFWNLVSTLILAISGIVINILIANTYYSAGLGRFYLSLSIYMMLSIFTNLGINIFVIKHVAEFRENQKELDILLSTSYIIVLLNSTIISFIVWQGCGLIVTLFNSPDMEPILKIFIIGLPFYSLNKISMAFLNGLRKMQVYAFIQSIRWIVILLIVAISIISIPKLEITVIAFPLTELLLFFGLAYYTKKLFTFKNINYIWLKKTLGFGSKSFLLNVTGQANEKLDILMIGYFMTDKAVGVYSFCSLIARNLLSLAGVIQLNFNPIISNLWAKNKTEKLLANINKIRKYTYMVYIPIILISILFYPILVKHLKDKEYNESVIPFFILLIGVFICSGFSVYGSLLTLTGFPCEQLKRILMTLAFNFIANVILIPSLGISGAALATSLSFIFSVHLLITSSKSILGIRII